MREHNLSYLSLSKKSSFYWAFSVFCGIIKLVIKMIVKDRIHRDQLEMFSIEDFVPADHLLRKIDSAVDFIHIYDLVEDLYSKDNGRPSVDPESQGDGSLGAFWLPLGSRFYLFDLSVK